MHEHGLVTRSGRKLEVQEYGDPLGHPIVFFHGLIGSHHQASYVSEQARREGMRIIAPNRPGVGSSDPVVRSTAVEVIDDVKDLVDSLGLKTFSVIGISGGAPYALAVLSKLPHRISTVTLISGMGPMQLPGALEGMEKRRRFFLEVGSRSRKLACRAFQTASDRFHNNPERFLKGLIRSWSVPDQRIFERTEIFDLFLKDLHQVFTEGQGAEGLAQELSIYRNNGFTIKDLPSNIRITLWHGVSDWIVPPAMAWRMVNALPNAEAHFVPGGHFMAIDIAESIVSRLKQLLFSA